MSIISQDNTNEVAIFDCVQRFFSSHKVGSLLKKCNGTKEKGVPAISLLKYKLSNVFVGRSMYMQQRTGSFKEDLPSCDSIHTEVSFIKTWKGYPYLLNCDVITERKEEILYTAIIKTRRNYNEKMDSLFIAFIISGRLHSIQ